MGTALQRHMRDCLSTNDKSELGVGSERSEHPVRLIVSLGALGSEPGGFFWGACLGGVLGGRAKPSPAEPSHPGRAEPGRAEPSRAGLQPRNSYPRMWGYWYEST